MQSDATIICILGQEGGGIFVFRSGYERAIERRIVCSVECQLVASYSSGSEK